MFGIYKITNSLNNKSYIGKSSHIESRWLYHTTRFNDSKEWNKSLYQAFRKYGIENFTFEVIEEMSEEYYNKFGNNREEFWIIYYNSLNNGYNETAGGDGGRNENSIKKCSKLTKEEIMHVRTLYGECQTCFADAYELYKHKITRRGFQAIWLGQNHKEIMPEVYNEDTKRTHLFLEHQRTGRLRRAKTEHIL